MIMTSRMLEIPPSACRINSAASVRLDLVKARKVGYDVRMIITGSWRYTGFLAVHV
jgi:hypothetical protein